MKPTSSTSIGLARGVVYTILWAVSDHLWDFFSGVVAGLGANVFTTRALSTGASKPTAWMWMEFAVFLGSSGSGIAAGLIRRRIEERWRAGGSTLGHEGIFLGHEIAKLSLFGAAAILLLVAGLLMVRGG